MTDRVSARSAADTGLPDAGRLAESAVRSLNSGARAAPPAAYCGATLFWAGPAEDLPPPDVHPAIATATRTPSVARPAIDRLRMGSSSSRVLVTRTSCPVGR